MSELSSITTERVCHHLYILVVYGFTRVLWS